MNNNESFIVLDTSCLLGTHRLASIFDSSNKLILSPEVRDSAWPSDIEIMEFSMVQQSLSGKKLNNIDWQKSIIQDVLKREKEKVHKIVELLQKRDFLIIPDYEEWPTSFEKRSQFDSVYLPKQLEYITALQSEKTDIRIGTPDFKAYFACKYYGYLPATFRPEVSFFLKKYYPTEYREKSDDFSMPGNLNIENIEKYLNCLQKKQAIPYDKFGPTKIQAIKRYGITIGKNIISALLGLFGTTIDTVKDIVEEKEQIRDERMENFQEYNIYKDKQIRNCIVNAVINSTDDKNVTILENFANFIERPRQRSDS